MKLVLLGDTVMPKIHAARDKTSQRHPFPGTATIRTVAAASNVIQVFVKSSQRRSCRWLTSEQGNKMISCLASEQGDKMISCLGGSGISHERLQE